MVPGTEKPAGEESKKYNEPGQKPVGATHARVKLSTAGEIDGKLKIIDDDSENSNVTSAAEDSEEFGKYVLLDVGSDDSEHTEQEKGLWNSSVVETQELKPEDKKTQKRMKNLKTKVAKNDPYF